MLARSYRELGRFLLVSSSHNGRAWVASRALPEIVSYNRVHMQAQHASDTPPCAPAHLADFLLAARLGVNADLCYSLFGRAR